MIVGLFLSWRIFEVYGHRDFQTGEDLRGIRSQRLFDWKGSSRHTVIETFGLGRIFEVLITETFRLSLRGMWSQRLSVGEDPRIIRSQTFFGWGGSSNHALIDFLVDEDLQGIRSQRLFGWGGSSSYYNLRHTVIENSRGILQNIQSQKVLEPF